MDHLRVFIKKFTGLVGILLFFAGFAAAQDWKNYPYSPEGSLLSFPADEGRHAGEPIEWWYTSGHLTGAITGNQYSFMISYFYYPISGYDGFRILNLSHENTGEFYTNTLPMTLNTLGSDSLNIDVTVYPDIQETWQNKQDGSGKMIPFEYVLSAASDEATLVLEYVTLKRPLILADSGLFAQGASSYTYYYSQTKNEASGEISFKGITESVSGTAWIDRQFGSFNPLNKEDYEWFCLQLSNEMDINVWNVFSRTSEIPQGSAYRLMAAYVDEETQISTDNFIIERLGYQWMADSGRCYAQQWRLMAPDPDLDLIITTFHANSEVFLPFRFFEGATTITGSVDGVPVTGLGFAELLHGYEKPQIKLMYPGGKFWNTNRPIAWRLENPDDGRPVKYNVECSVDDKKSFFTIATALSDTTFSWNEPDLAEGDSCWFRVTAYSIDSVLINSVVSRSPSAYDPNLTSIDPEAVGNRVLKIYPNPAEKLVKIELQQDHPFREIQLIDLTGRILIRKPAAFIQFMELETGPLNPGMYFVRFLANEKYYSERLVIQRK